MTCSIKSNASLVRRQYNPGNYDKENDDYQTSYSQRFQGFREVPPPPIFIGSRRVRPFLIRDLFAIKTKIERYRVSFFVISQSNSHLLPTIQPKGRFEIQLMPLSHSKVPPALRHRLPSVFSGPKSGKSGQFHDPLPSS